MKDDQDGQPDGQTRGRKGLLASASFLVKSGRFGAIALGLLSMNPSAVLATGAAPSATASSPVTSGVSNVAIAGIVDAPNAGETTIETVVVTARRRVENLDDVPLAVSAIGGHTLDVQRLDRLSDYAAKLSVIKTFGTDLAAT